MDVERAKGRSEFNTARAHGRASLKAIRHEGTKEVGMSDQEAPPIPKEVEDIGYRVIGCGITVHKILGPGFKEMIYHRAFAWSSAKPV